MITVYRNGSGTWDVIDGDRVVATFSTNAAAWRSWDLSLSLLDLGTTTSESRPDK
jgi:hypothetical protein